MTQTLERKSATREDGTTIRYIDTGTGDPPLVFIHGWTCNLTNWAPQIQHFAKKHRVIALDLRGHGESDKPDEDSSIGTFINDVVWLIGELCLGKPVLIGHSMGGVIAMNLARRHPDVASAVVLVDAPLGLPEATKALREQIFAGFASPAYQAVVDQFARQFFFNADSPPALIEEVVAGAQAAPQRVIVTALQSALSPEHDEPGAIPVPSLFIRAGTHLASEDELRTRFPGMGLVTVPNAAHFVQLEQPAATNNIITDFLDKLE